MAGPFIVKTVSRIHPGRAAEYRPLVEEICHLAEQREPRLLAFHIYVTDDESSEVVVQIHTDAESMQPHLQELGEKVRATAEFGDFESLEIYGELDDALRQWLPHVTEGITFTHHSTHWGGFRAGARHYRRERMAAARCGGATDLARCTTSAGGRSRTADRR